MGILLQSYDANVTSSLFILGCSFILQVFLGNQYFMRRLRMAPRVVVGWFTGNAIDRHHAAADFGV